MTLKGAIAELTILREHPMMPDIFKSSIQKIIETVSECKEPSAQPEIIRCKDCKHRPDKAWFGCPMSASSKWKLDGFCSCAERIEDG